MRELGVTGRFLLLPCSRQANYRHLLLKDEEGQVVDQIHAQLCPPEQQEYVTLVHTQEFADRGMRLTLTADNRVSQFAKPQGESADEAQLALQESWPYYAETVEAYHEPQRPLAHFTSLRGWINDANGPIWVDGVYHLYYQYEPGNLMGIWDNSEWGHATSTDLYHWREEEPVLRYPCASSGSAWIRRETGRPCIAYKGRIYESRDGGYHYELLTEHPEVGGDPKIFYHEESGRYVCFALKGPDAYKISVSPDLFHWEETSVLRGFHECPDIVRLRVDGDGEEKWALISGDMSYIFGRFDGRQLIPEPIEPDRADRFVPVHGNSAAMQAIQDRYNGCTANAALADDWSRFFAYAFQTFAHQPDGRTLRIGWLDYQANALGAAFTECQSVVQELSLRTTRYGVRLCAMPAREIANGYEGEAVAVGAGERVRMTCPAADITARFPVGSMLEIAGFRMVYDREAQELCIAREALPDFRIPYPLQVGEQDIRVRMIRDRGSAEIFFGDGEIYAPQRVRELNDTWEAAAGAGAEITVQPLGSLFAQHPDWIR